ncbi:MAG: GntR family transcriptional regulator [Lentisphaeria bacterium]|nr:GntR family transcriptional regulator [Lentisphaeria bacterium]
MLKKISLAEQAYDELVKNIITGVHSGGEMLQEERLAADFGISRTPVREALQRLAAEGLVEQLPRRGFRVALPEEEALSELFECRCVLETSALQKSIHHIPAEEIEELRKKLSAIREETEEARHELLAADEIMHDLFTEYCGNRYLSSLIRQFRLKTAPYRNYRNCEVTPLTELSAERIAILDALLKKETAKASDLLANHIHKGRCRKEKP